MALTQLLGSAEEVQKAKAQRQAFYEHALERILDLATCEGGRGQTWYENQVERLETEINLHYFASSWLWDQCNYPELMFMSFILGKPFIDEQKNLREAFRRINI